MTAVPLAGPDQATAPGASHQPASQAVSAPAAPRATATPRRRRRTQAIAAGTALLVVALAACSSHNQVPRSWIASQYDSRGGTYEADDAPREVAREIAGHTSPRDRVNRNNRIYLRYRNDIVRVSSRGTSNSRIVIEKYRSGYQRWSSDISGYWPAPNSSGGGHRGGGSGSGGK